ncbi:MAG: 2-oxoacid:acceptor oxidoreductase family protein [Candidatus Acetothermia bacterium]|jgi:2-oxoglutarate ferredoxin oxidoreductase subunit gamma|nr:2-oxoacid:acceptor oxidoreductase family protein [Candidatus Acetothermia bacterium]
MEIGVIFAGFGGQGILLAGKVLARAGMDQGLEVTWLPSYGPEMRGGTANCTVILADEPVGSPIVDAPRALVALNGPSLDRFEPKVAPGGAVVVNSSLVPRPVRRKDVQGIPVPVNDIARELGEPRAINMVALGAVVRALGILPLQAVVQAMAEELGAKGRERLVEANRLALRRGHAACPP